MKPLQTEKKEQILDLKECNSTFELPEGEFTYTFL